MTKRLKVLLWTFISCLLLNAPAFAQMKKISGTVSSQVSNEALAGSTITVKGTNRVTKADEKGQFSI